MLDPVVLFFLAGLIAVAVRSDLEIPQPIPRLLSLYVLLAIGLKGGFELQDHGVSWSGAQFLCLSVGFAVLTPLLLFPLLRRFLELPDAAALAAAYGSVSAVTFAAAQSLLEERAISVPGVAVVAMVFMEAPAILIGLIIYRMNSSDASNAKSNWKKLIHEALTNSSVFLLLTGVVVGLLANEKGRGALDLVFGVPFKGVLCLFLLDMGLLSAKRLGLLISRKSASYKVLVFGVCYPFIAGFLASGASFVFGFDRAESFLLATLVSSASYIAVPAAMRIAIPRAQPGIYIGSALGMTFPINLFFGIPFHYWFAMFLRQM